ncbi:MAG: CPBP family intramembrane metalloprotease [Candidatus Krumholzibacteriota bacterium]|nr:CPBP family intramembrane metalloprotease [Candidatus Krumholzibacteriota bacterium]
MNASRGGDGRIGRNVAIYSILVIGLGWLGRWVDAATGCAPGEGPGMAVWIAAPLVASFALRLQGGDGWRDLGIRPAFTENGRWYAVSALIYPVAVLVVLAAGRAAGVTAFLDGALPLRAAALLVVPQLLTNIPEEFGFRGYLAPRLSALRVNALAGHALVGLVWGAWHLPYLAAITGYTAEGAATLIPRFLAGTVAASLVYGEIRLRTGSVWPAVLMQTTGGVAVGAALAGGAVLPATPAAMLLAPTLEGGLMIALFLFAGLGLHALRTRPPR